MTAIKPVTIELTKGEVVCIRWLLNNAGLVNKQGAMTLLDLEDNIQETREAETYNGEVWADAIPEKTISSVSVVWLIDLINKKFDATQIPSPLARPMLALYDKCVKAKDGLDA